MINWDKILGAQIENEHQTNSSSKVDDVQGDIIHNCQISGLMAYIDTLAEYGMMRWDYSRLMKRRITEIVRSCHGAEKMNNLNMMELDLDDCFEKYKMNTNYKYTDRTYKIIFTGMRRTLRRY